jgi:Uma2 family endonuclease
MAANRRTWSALVSTTKSRSLLRAEYEEAARAYRASLPLEHFMESTLQATQRKITLASMDLVHARRPDVQCFNELCIQYPYGRERRIRRVIPDNMVVVHPEAIVAVGSYDMPFQPAKPFWVLEYVSEGNPGKDYDDNFHKYERDLKVDYCLLFRPARQALSLYHRGPRKYVRVRPDQAGRLPIAELDLEVALLDGWVRFWSAGVLLELPADLERRALRAEKHAQRAEKQALQAEKQAQQARDQAEEALSQAEQAREQTRHALEQAQRDRAEKERLLAHLRSLGLEPPP